jgi:hypothetical protein
MHDIIPEALRRTDRSAEALGARRSIPVACAGGCRHNAGAAGRGRRTDPGSAGKEPDMKSHLVTCCALAMLVGGAPPALADEVDAPGEEIAGPAETAPEEAETAQPMAETHPTAPVDRDPSEEAIADWNGRRGWSYGTDYLFPLSRGMREAGIPRGARIPLYLFTVPLDVVQLPLGAIAGLYGS